ncbi:MAG: putative DNA-binding domain-containing protein [Myxococcota bacterium]|nr:putative DNA-binding domain-containing protein [Myxococcota bacterium]
MADLQPPRGSGTLQRALRELLAGGMDPFLPHDTAEAAELRSLLRAIDRDERPERADIYANPYFYQLRDSLAADFPRLGSCVGATAFRDLVSDFLLERPPTQHSFRDFGRPLPDFLASHEIARTTPGIADLAALELARLDCFDAADTTPLTRQQLLDATTDARQSVRLALVPAARLLHLSRAGLSLWSEHHPRTAIRDDSPEPRVAVCVWRRGFEVFHRPSDPTEARCLAALSAPGTTLDRIAGLVAKRVAPHEAATRLARMLDVWTADGLLYRPA